MFADFLHQVKTGQKLNAAESEQAFSALLSGSVPEQEIADFLTALHKRGEAVEEVLGAARALRGAMRAFQGAEDAIDVVGTGGDGLSTLNISTAVTFILAGAGVRVAKHGNRAVSSKSGASDVLTALGVNSAASPYVMHLALQQANICFLAAPLYHPVLFHVAAVRARLGFRTIFNLLGPLANPAKVKRQLVGVFDERWMQPFASILRDLGATHSWVVHGEDGMDEITTTTLTKGVELKNNALRPFEIVPEDARLIRALPEHLKGGDAAANAAALLGLLKGKQGYEGGAYRDAVCLNAAAGFIVAEKVSNLQQGLALATETLDNGKALQTLETFIRITNQS